MGGSLDLDFRSSNLDDTFGSQGKDKQLISEIKQKKKAKKKGAFVMDKEPWIPGPHHMFSFDIPTPIPL